MASTLLTAVPAAAQATIRLSEVGGVGGDQESRRPSISEDGRYTVFGSIASNLGAPAFLCGNVYRHDALTDTLLPLTQLDCADQTTARDPVISDDGAWTAFITTASLDPSTEDPMFRGSDVYVTDDGTSYFRISKTLGGGVTIHSVVSPQINGDGRYVVFETNGPEFVPPGMDTNGVPDVFLVDRDPDGDGLVPEFSICGILSSSTTAPRRPRGLRRAGLREPGALPRGRGARHARARAHAQAVRRLLRTARTLRRGADAAARGARHLRAQLPRRQRAPAARPRAPEPAR